MRSSEGPQDADAKASDAASKKKESGAAKNVDQQFSRAATQISNGFMQIQKILEANKASAVRDKSLSAFGRLFGVLGIGEAKQLVEDLFAQKNHDFEIHVAEIEPRDDEEWVRVRRAWELTQDAPPLKKAR